MRIILAALASSLLLVACSGAPTPIIDQAETPAPKAALLEDAGPTDDAAPVLEDAAPSAPDAGSPAPAADAGGHPEVDAGELADATPPTHESEDAAPPSVDAGDVGDASAPVEDAAPSPWSGPTHDGSTPPVVTCVVALPDNSLQQVSLTCGQGDAGTSGYVSITYPGPSGMTETCSATSLPPDPCGWGTPQTCRAWTNGNVYTGTCP